MNGIENDRFLELAQKVMAGNASITEQGELEGLLAEHPSLRAQFEQLRRDAVLVREFLPLLDALDAPPVEVPEAEQERLSAKVRKVVQRLESEGAADAAAKPSEWSGLWFADVLNAKSPAAMETICHENGFSAEYINPWKPGTQEPRQKLSEKFFAWLFQNRDRMQKRFNLGSAKSSPYMTARYSVYRASDDDRTQSKTTPGEYPDGFERAMAEWIVRHRREWRSHRRSHLEIPQTESGRSHRYLYAAIKAFMRERRATQTGDRERPSVVESEQKLALPALKILFVENNEVFARTVTREFLAQHAVTVMPSIAAARQARAEAAFDLLLVDYDLDDGKGDTFVRELRLAGDLIAIVGISSHEAGNAALQRAGVSAICSKMEFDSIERVIEELKPRRNTVEGVAGEGKKDDEG